MKAQDHYYSMTGSSSGADSDPVEFPQDTDEFELWDLVESLTSMDEWSKPDLKCEGKLGHYPSTDWLGRLCSPELRRILEPFAVDARWLPANVHCGSSVQTYFFMHFTEIPDVLDESRSEYINGKLLRPCLDREKVREHNVFALRKLGLQTFVHKIVHDALIECNLALFSFEKTDIN